MASVVISGDTSGTATLQAQAVAGNTVLTLPTTSGTIALASVISGTLLNIQYITTTGPYTATVGTNSVIVEVVGGGYGGSNGGTTSFGSLVSATGGQNGAGGLGVSGDLNAAGGSGGTSFGNSIATGGDSAFGYGGGTSGTGQGFGAGGSGGYNGYNGGGGGGARKRITSGFNGQTVTIGAAGGAAATAGICIVYEYT